MAGVATFTNNPNANTGITLSGSLGPKATTIQGGSPQLQGQPITIQGSGAPSGGNILTKAPVVTHSNGPIAGYSSLDAYIASLNAQLAAANQKVYAPVLDTNAIYNQAQTTANNNVNPYYTKLLNDFITQQGVARGQETQQTAVNKQNLEDTLTNTLAANATTGARTTEDTAQTEANIAAAADQRQTDQGTAFDQARNKEAISLAGSGLTGSGLGANAQATAQATQDTTEQRQATADEHARQAAELTKARTFEDIGTSNTLATQTKTKGEAQADFDLNKFITGQTSQLQGEQADLEQKRQAAVATETDNQTKIAVNNFINSIANPAQREAAIQTYGAWL